MNYSVIKEEDCTTEDYGDTKVTTLINTPSWPFSVAKIQKVGNDIKEGTDTESDVVYYVLEGKGTAHINGKPVTLSKGDCFISPKGTRYKNGKGLTLLAIAHPRFDRDKRIYHE